MVTKLGHKPRREDAAGLQEAFRTASHTANSANSTATQSNDTQDDTQETPSSVST